jgi:polyisoprenyl-phosphate glycosyltransferase
VTQIRTKPCLSVVLPAYNERGSLPNVINAVFEALKDEDIDIEVLVVDDGSSDGTEEAIRALDRVPGALRYVRLSRNFGKEAALSAGLDFAKGHAVVVMDADGQHPPEVLKIFLAKWRGGAEMVCGVQKGIHERALHRRARGLYYALLEGNSSISIPRHAGDFRLLDRKVVDALKSLPERNRYMKGLFAWVGFKIEFIEFQVARRFAGKTKFNWRRLFSLALTGLTSFSVVPLRLVSLLGLFMSSLSLIYGLYLVIAHYMDDRPLPGFATIAVGMMFLSGLQFLALGVISEYLGRTFNEVKGRPVYIVAEDRTIGVPSFDAEPLPQKTTPLDAAHPRFDQE